MSRSKFNREGKKKKKKRIVKNIVLIVSEGKTETRYFDRFNRYNDLFRIISVYSKERDPIHLIKKHAKTAINKYNINKKRDFVWLVFDFDENEERVEEAIKIAKKENFNVALSIPSFELWIVLHYRFWEHRCTNEDINTEVEKQIPNHKSRSDIYEVLYPNIQVALDNAKKLKNRKTDLNEEELYTSKANPITHVFKLVELLESGRK